jgi:bifunctional DNA-binding transcriptional regulator/antitoxin component of YhaV-PrlF toxin-antitoxin module
MTKLTITAKGQVTLKQELLKHLGVAPGEKIEADTLPDGRIVVRAAAHEGKIADFIGCLSQTGGSRLTIDQMNEITKQGWANGK